MTQTENTIGVTAGRTKRLWELSTPMITALALIRIR